MANLSSLEKKKIKDMFDSGGYVMDFTNLTFESFFKTTVGKNIYHSLYESYGTSKWKRLASFIEIESDQVVGKILTELLAYWKHLQLMAGEPTKTKLSDELEMISNRLLGKVQSAPSASPEEEFLKKSYKISFQKLDIDTNVVTVLEKRFNEALISFQYGAYLSAVFMSGSILEGALLGVAVKNPKEFNTSSSSPKYSDGKVKGFHDWKLAELIDVAADTKMLSLDVKKFGHALRDFRNYIHPCQELASGFTPDKHTAEICMQVLKAAIASLSGDR